MTNISNWFGLFFLENSVSHSKPQLPLVLIQPKPSCRFMTILVTFTCRFAAFFYYIESQILFVIRVRSHIIVSSVNVILLVSKSAKEKHNFIVFRSCDCFCQKSMLINVIFTEIFIGVNKHRWVTRFNFNLILISLIRFTEGDLLRKTNAVRLKSNYIKHWYHFQLKILRLWIYESLFLYSVLLSHF